MSSKDIAAAQKAVGDTEVVRVVVEAKFHKKADGSSTASRRLALVANKENPREMAVFSFKPGRLKWSLIQIFPINASFQLKPKEDYFFDLYYTRPSDRSVTVASYTFEALSHPSFESLVSHLSNAINIAASSGSGGTSSGGKGKSHVWLANYKPRDGVAPRKSPGDGGSDGGSSRGSRKGGGGSGTGGGSVKGKGGGGGGGADAATGIGSTSTSTSTTSPSAPVAAASPTGSTLLYEDIKEDWVRKQMKSREAEFVTFEDLNVFIGSWNVNGKKPGEDLGPWIRPPAGQPIPDVYVVGFQEMDLSAESFIFQSTDRAEPWQEAIEAVLAKQGVYSLVAWKQMVGIFVVVYATREIGSQIRMIESQVAPTGIAQVVGNKGGVVVRFEIHNTSFCFVNSHLAARMENTAKRNNDHATIQRRVAFATPTGDMSILDHDIVIWFGDLNYRIEGSFDAIVKQVAKVKKADYKWLLDRDQLVQQRRHDKVFVGYEEPPITFKPTYKYDPGTLDTWDTSEKKRAPAYCDRVLYVPNGYIKPTHYTSAHELKSSDHKPISAGFGIKVKKVRLADQKALRKELLAELDRHENDTQPSAALSEAGIDFGPVHRMVANKKSVVLKNTGKVYVQFRFVPKVKEKHYCKPWLHIRPRMGMILPGQSETISLTVLVDNDSAPALNDGKEKLSDVLILDIENGAKSLFLDVKGLYLRSAYGTSLETLTLTPDAIRKTAAGSVDKKERLSVPKELWALVDYLFKHAREEDGLFLEAGDDGEMQLIREALDNHEDLPEKVNPHSVAESLIRFLDALPEPLVPFSLYQAAVDNSSNYSACRGLLQHFPPVHYKTFIYVTAFLRELLSEKYKAANGLNAERVSMTFGKVMLRPPHAPRTKYTVNAQSQVVRAAPPPTKSADKDDRKRAQFLFHFLIDQQ